MLFNLRPFSKGRSTRHQEANNIIKRALTSIGLHPVLEPPGLMARTDGKRPDGMSLIPYSHGKCLIWDITIVDTVAPSYLPCTAICPGAAAEKAEARKRTKYSVLSNDYVFIPIAIETLGPQGPSARSFIKDISQKLIEATGNPKEGSWFKERLSIAIQRGNAISVMGTHCTDDTFLLNC